MEPAAAAKTPLHEMDLEVLELYLSVPESVPCGARNGRFWGILSV